MKKVAFLLLSVFLAQCTLYGDTANIQKKISDFLTSKKYSGNGLGIVIKDIENDTCLVKINENDQLNPASVSKLVTGAAAFELLGSDFNFGTDIYLDQMFDRDSGTINGNIYIRGGADPGFTAERLWLLVQHLYHNGVRKINGNLVLDDSFFDTVSVGPGFDEDSTSRAYQPLISPLSVSFNTLAIHTRSGNASGSPVVVDIFPKIRGISVISSAKTIESGKSGIVDVQTASTSNGTSVIVKGTMSLNEEPKYIYRKVWQTWEVFGGAVVSLFDETGIGFSGKVIHGVTPESLQKKPPFYRFESETLPYYVNHMFKYSSNFAAEMIFKTIPSVVDSTRGSWPLGTVKVLSWWQKCGLPGIPVIKNGSGMGNTNRISAFQIEELLSHVWKQKTYLPEYLNALSVSGIDGTLKSRFKKSPLKGLVRGKTGTLNSYGISALAGYLMLPKGTYSFAIICSKVGGGQYDNWVIQEQTLEKFASLVGGK